MKKLILAASILAASGTAFGQGIDVISCDLYPVNRYAQQESDPLSRARQCVAIDYGVSTSQVSLEWVNSTYDEYLFTITMSSSTYPVQVVDTEVSL